MGSRMKSNGFSIRFLLSNFKPKIQKVRQTGSRESNT